MVESVYVTVFPMPHPIAVFFTFLHEPVRTSLIKVGLHALGVDCWMHILPYQWRGDKTCVVLDDLHDLLANFGWSAIARKTWMFNELADRNTRDKENGVISPRILHVKRKDLTSLFGKKDTINELISGGKQKATAFVLPFRMGPVKHCKLICHLQ